MAADKSYLCQLRFLFFFLLFTFNSIFLLGLPLYVYFLPFLNKKFGSFFYEFKYNASIREIVIICLIYSLVLVTIDTFHGYFVNSVFRIFCLNSLVLYIGVKLFAFAKNDKRGSGLVILLVIFFLNGLVALMQSYGSIFFWELPERFHVFLGSDISESKYVNMSFDEFSRVRGLFLNIHKFSPAIMLLSVVLFWHSITQKKLRIIFFLGAIVTFYASILTFSRSIFVGLIIGIFIIVCKYFSRYLLLLTFVFLLLVMFPSSSQRNYGTGMGIERFTQSNAKMLSNNDNYRIQGYLMSLDNFLENPLIGSYNYSGNREFEKVTVHNILLRLLGNYGLLGLFAYLIFLYRVFKIVFHSSSRKFKFLFIIIFSILVTEILTHSSGFQFYDVFQFSLMMLLFGYSKNLGYV